MTDLETLLRNEFDEQAAAVPGSVDPWQKHKRLLHRRRAVLSTSAAAAVVIGALLAVVLLRKGLGPQPPAGGAPTATTATTTTGVHTQGPPMPADTTAGPLLFDERDGWQASFYVRGADLVCIAVARKGEYPDPDTADCAPAVKDGSPVQMRAVGPTGGPFRELLLVIVDSGVRELVVRDGAGEPVAVTEFMGSPALNIGVADFHGSTQGFGYEGVDARGQHFSAIT